MFPNYCFRKPPDDFGYEVVYMPKSCYNSNVPQSNRPEIHSRCRSRNQLRQRTKLCYDDMISLQAIQEHNERLRLSHSVKPRSRTPARTVEFRLPPVEQHRHRETTQPLRESGGMATTERDYCQKQQQQPQKQQPQQHQQQQQQEASPPGCVPSSQCDSNRDMQDSCADFFNIIYENVLEAVHGAIEHMVSKHFEEIMPKIDQLSANLSQQQTFLKQLNTDVMGKIAEQNEASVNQFKFIAQMLIDNQTIYYRALSQPRHLKQQRSEDRDEQKRSSTENYMRSTESESPQPLESHSQPSPQHQHRLWQQQDHGTSHQQPPVCKNSKTHKSYLRSERSTACRPTVLRRSAKGASTASMPDLHRGSLYSTSNCNNNKSKARSPASAWAQGGTERLASQAAQSGIVGSYRKCRCQCQGQTIVSPRRKTHSHSKTMPSLEDVRVHR